MQYFGKVIDCVLSVISSSADKQGLLFLYAYMVKLNSAIRIVFYHLCEDDDISSALPFDHFPMQSGVCKPITDWLTL